MHPYVYKKQHKPIRAVRLIFIVIMILCPVTAHSCNLAVKDTQIYSQLSKGFLRIEDNRVVAYRDDKYSDLYKITIDQHYILLFDVRNKKFICWNKSFRRLLVRRNPTNLRFCKFEEKISRTRNGSDTRYTTQVDDSREVEIRFNKNGAFPTHRFIKKCFSRHKINSTHCKNFKFPKYEKNMTSKEEECYNSLRKCASPDFMAFSRSINCTDRLPEFCATIKDLKDAGHNITLELTDLCKNEWNKWK